MAREKARKAAWNAANRSGGGGRSVADRQAKNQLKNERKAAGTARKAATAAPPTAGRSSGT